MTYLLKRNVSKKKAATLQPMPLSDVFCEHAGNFFALHVKHFNLIQANPKSKVGQLFLETHVKFIEHTFHVLPSSFTFFLIA